MDMESVRSQIPESQIERFEYLNESYAGYHEAFLLKYLREQHGAVLESFPYSQAIKNHHRSQSQGHLNDFPYGIVQKSTETSFVYLCCTYCEAGCVRKYLMRSDIDFSCFFPYR